MNLRPLVIGASFLAHGALVYALGEIRVDEAAAATAIEVVETTKEKPKPPPVEVEPPPPQKTEQKSRNTKPETAPPPDASPPPNSTAPLADLPDFGLDLSGGGTGPGGFAVAQGKGPLNQPRTAPVQKTLAPTSNLPAVSDSCQEPAAKPKLIHAPQPAYSDAARAAGIEGKVRLQLTVDENGQVLDAKIFSGLGYGLDELALAAARAVTFEGAIRCGKPTRSTVNFAFRFSAS